MGKNPAEPDPEPSTSESVLELEPEPPKALGPFKNMEKLFEVSAPPKEIFIFFCVLRQKKNWLLTEKKTFNIPGW